MGDVLSPFTVSPPPPPSSSSSNSGMSMLYYGLAVVGTAAIILAMYNLIIIRRCSRRHVQPSQPPDLGDPRDDVEVMITARASSSSSAVDESFSNRNLLSSFKYNKKAQDIMEDEDEDEGRRKEEYDDYECPVCLSVFEEGEEVRKLPRCNHSFHAVCIDMWLYSHFDCPICRTSVVQLQQQVSHPQLVSSV